MHDLLFLRRKRDLAASRQPAATPTAKPGPKRCAKKSFRSFIFMTETKIMQLSRQPVATPTPTLPGRVPETRPWSATPSKIVQKKGKNCTKIYTYTA